MENSARLFQTEFRQIFHCAVKLPVELKKMQDALLLVATQEATWGTQ